jgi:hypothetical protein
MKVNSGGERGVKEPKAMMSTALLVLNTPWRNAYLHVD